MKREKGESIGGKGREVGLDKLCSQGRGDRRPWLLSFEICTTTFETEII
jgi:hypothetical protein